MTDSPSEPSPAHSSPAKGDRGEDEALYYYKFRFRKLGPESTGHTPLADLTRGDQVMVRSEHGVEPAIVTGRFPDVVDADQPFGYRIHRLANAEELEKYAVLPQMEQDAFRLCQRQIERLDLPMHMVRVERFFNGSKIIFYFTAESRVDFRELVKALVQEFRTRVEMRQIGVRHETQMIGGLGPCGRELCCASFLNKFDSVSIKMAKTQDLPLNPAKISGLCNRLLCCLTYEYETYKAMKKGMPRLGRQIQFEDRIYQVSRLIPLLGKVAAVASDGEERLFSEEEWRAAEPIPKNVGRKGPGKRSRHAAIDIWGIQGEQAEDD
jgi:cell fate regulator YaaT (PSP1 superfamily)